MVQKTTQLIYELIENIGVHSVSTIRNATKKLSERDLNLIFEQVQNIYQSIDDDIEVLRKSDTVLKAIPSGYLNFNSPLVCGALECRGIALESACKKLILYTDVISINDPLSPALRSIAKNGLTDLNLMNFEDALYLLLIIKPIADEGMLLLSPDIGNWGLCEKCIERLAIEAMINIDKACDIFCRKNQVTLYCESDQDYSACFNFCDSGHHDLRVPLDKEDIGVNLLSKLKQNDTKENLFYNLSIQEAKNFSVMRSTVSKICLQLNWAATLAEKLEGVLVTDSLSEWDLLNQKANLFRPTIIENDFEVPFIENIELSDLIAIRKSEPISFENFRLSLSKIKKEFPQEKRLSKDEFTYYIKNSIVPKLKIIDEDFRKIRKRTLVKSVATSAIACIFASVGFYEGAYSPVLFTAIQQLGLLGIAFEGLHICSEHFQSQREIKNRAPYFLWKALKRKE